MVITFDTKGPTFRNEIYEGYKAQRGPPPESLGPQFDVAFEACEAFGWPYVAMEGYEADDLIATCVETARAERPVVVVGSDKDLMQLVDSRTVMVDPVKKVMLRPHLASSSSSSSY